jgi:hypothetical protein
MDAAGDEGGVEGKEVVSPPIEPDELGMLESLMEGAPSTEARDMLMDGIEHLLGQGDERCARDVG